MKRSHDHDEKACGGVLVLPSNAQVMRTNFSLSEMKAVQPEDIDLVTKVISYCAHKIAKKHQSVKVWIDTHRETYLSVKLFKYLLQIQMPRDITLPNSHQMNAIHALSLELITDPIAPKITDDGIVLEVQIYSHKNPYTIEYKSITHIQIKSLVLTHPEQDVSGAVKRSRKG